MREARMKKTLKDRLSKRDEVFSGVRVLFTQRPVRVEDDDEDLNIQEGLSSKDLLREELSKSQPSLMTIRSCINKTYSLRTSQVKGHSKLSDLFEEYPPLLEWKFVSSNIFTPYFVIKS
jgi:hypothetical protein